MTSLRCPGALGSWIVTRQVPEVMMWNELPGLPCYVCFWPVVMAWVGCLCRGVLLVFGTFCRGRYAMFWLLREFGIDNVANFVCGPSGLRSERVRVTLLAGHSEGSDSSNVKKRGIRSHAEVERQTRPCSQDKSESTQWKNTCLTPSTFERLPS